MENYIGDGDDPWPTAQLDAIECVSAAICRAHGWNAASAIGHPRSTHQCTSRGSALLLVRVRFHEALGVTPNVASFAPFTAFGVVP